VHKSKDRVNVRLIDPSPGELWVLVVFYTPSANLESLLSLKFYPDKSRKFTILESPEISAFVNAAGYEPAPKKFFYDVP
jgi:hypothetical protein